MANTLLHTQTYRGTQSHIYICYSKPYYTSPRFRHISSVWFICVYIRPFNICGNQHKRRPACYNSLRPRVNFTLCCSRNRLEYYEQSCAVDSLTKKCAGPPSECRKAMLGILGTELRSNCACKGTDFTQLYDCLGWQRLLWVNPCVG